MGESLVRSLGRLWRDPLAFFATLAREQGDLAHVRLGWQHLFLVGSPPLVYELMVTRHASFAKGAPLRRARVLLGDGLLTSEGDAHRRQRRCIQPAFDRRRLAGYVEVVARYGVEAQAGWVEGRPFEASAAMLRLAQRAVAKSLFDTDLEEERAREASRALDTLVGGFGLLLLLPPLVLALPLPATVRLRRARATLDRLVAGMIADRRASGDRGDVLSMLIAGGMDDALVRDEVMTLFLAGHDTTGHALAWTWHLLARHPAAEALWHREIDAVVGDRLPTADDVRRLPYTRGVLAEAMRLFPPVPAIGRRATEPAVLGGVRVPRGAIVEVCPWLLHRDARWFPEPERFLPERWEGEADRRVPRGAYVPFGIGPRQCIGMDFAWLAATVLLVVLGRRWRLRPVDDRPVEFLPRSITLRPKHGLAMCAERRGDA